MDRTKCILTDYDGDRKNVVVPEGTLFIRGEEIAFGSEFEREDRILWQKRTKAPFSRDKRIESVTMGDSVRAIGPKAFEHCSALFSITLSSNLEYIGPSAFLGCVSLREIHLPSSLKSVGEWAFSFCHFDKVVYDGTILEVDKILRYETSFSARILETKDGILDFSRSDWYIDDYCFPGSEKEWREKYGSHWLNRRARRIHTNDGKTMEN
ncbi:MAG: leucine-rich repeat domain-containing protein [Candidatus Ornithospirochaeta sp.]